MSGFGSNQVVTSNGQSERSFDYEWTIFFFFYFGTVQFDERWTPLVT